MDDGLRRMFHDDAEWFVAMMDHKPLPGDLRERLESIVGANRLRGRVLDLGCGPGRLTRVLGRDASAVVGLDFSERFLSVCRERHADFPVASFVHGDMRHLEEAVAGPFDLIARVYTSMGYFDEAEERAILAACHRLAGPGGAVVVDTFNGDWFRARGTVERVSRFGPVTLRERYAHDPRTSKVACTWTYEADWNAPCTLRFELEAYGPERLLSLMESAGWRGGRCYADYTGVPLEDAGAAPERLVAVATKE